MKGATALAQVTARVAVATGGTTTLAPIVALQPLGAPVAERLTVPEKVPVGWTVIVEETATFGRVVISFGKADKVNPPALTVTGTFRVRVSVLGEVPAAPVTMTVNPVVGNGVHVTDNVALLNEAAQPVGTAPAEKLTVPANPLIAFTEIVEAPAVPAVERTMVGGVAERVKSWTVTLTLVVRERVLGAVPVVPVIVTLNGATPVVQLTDNTALAKEAVQPLGIVPAAKVTVPVNPLIGATATVDVPATVANVVIAGADSEKSTTWNRIEPLVWDSVPLMPVTVTV